MSNSFWDEPGVKGIGLAALAILIGGAIHENRSSKKNKPILLPKHMRIEGGGGLTGISVNAGNRAEATFLHEPDRPWSMDELDIQNMERVGVSDWEEQMRECQSELRKDHHVGMVVNGGSLTECGVDHGRIALISPLNSVLDGTGKSALKEGDVVLIASKCGRFAILRQLRKLVSSQHWQTCCAEKCIVLHENTFVGRLDCPTPDPCKYPGPEN